MTDVGVKLLRAGAAATRAARFACISREPSYPLRFFHQEASVSDAQPVAVQMINYALSHARSQKSGGRSSGFLMFQFYIFQPVLVTFLNFCV